MSEQADPMELDKESMICFIKAYMQRPISVNKEEIVEMLREVELICFQANLLALVYEGRARLEYDPIEGLSFHPQGTKTVFISDEYYDEIVQELRRQRGANPL